MRKSLLPFLAVALATGLACGSGSDVSPADGADATPTPSAAGPTADADPDPTDGAPTPAATVAAPTPESSVAPAKAAPLTCKQLATAPLGSAAQPYQGYADPIPLIDGLWSGEDGVVVQLQSPCAIGELTGDDAADAVVAVLMDGGGTGKFWQLAVYRNVAAKPRYLTMTDIGDRTPVEQVSIGGRQVTAVFLMRPEDPSSTTSLIRRTATYRLKGDKLVETAHTDAPA